MKSRGNYIKPKTNDVGSQNMLKRMKSSKNISHFLEFISIFKSAEKRKKTGFSIIARRTKKILFSDFQKENEAVVFRILKQIRRATWMTNSRQGREESSGICTACDAESYKTKNTC